MNKMIIGLMIICGAVVIDAVAQELTYCKNYETGEIIIIDNGVCPTGFINL